MGGLEKIQEGEILFDGKNINKIGLTQFRKKYVNIIFQSYNLINYLNVLENIILAIDINKVKVPNKKEYARELLNSVDITDKKQERKVLKISGGEQQRVAIARSMMVVYL